MAQHYRFNNSGFIFSACCFLFMKNTEQILSSVILTRFLGSAPFVLPRVDFGLDHT
jgi:hypothetical protein